MLGVGLIAGVLAAWPTWIDASGSLNAAGAIAGTANPGNLDTPLHSAQIFGTWLIGSYRRVPSGRVTDVLIALTALAAVLGAVHAIRARAYALAAWLVLGLVVWFGLTAYGAIWTDAKVLMLTTPIVVLLAWGGVAGLRASPLARAAPLLGLILAGGVLVSDAMQYQATDLAPTARYAELASLDGRFGPGPTLVTDFDEWSLYALRKIDVGGPDFVYRPVGLERIAPNHGDPVDLDLIPPSLLSAYPLIVTGRNPLASRPPSAYRLLWQGTYYEVWGRRPDAAPAVAHVGLSAARPVSCTAIGLLGLLARAGGDQLISARAPRTVRINLTAAPHPGWHPASIPRLGLVMRPHGQLRAAFQIPHGAVWDVWIQGEIMPTVELGIDGHRLAALGGQVRGSVFNPDTLPPLAIRLAAGPHVLTLTRGGTSAAPGGAGSAVLHAIFLTLGGGTAGEALQITAPGRWRTLCSAHLDWVEAASALAPSGRGAASPRSGPAGGSTSAGAS